MEDVNVSGGSADRPWQRATRTAQEVGEQLAGRAADVGRRLREARLEERLGAAVESRPWTALAVALGIGVALAVAAGGRERPRTVATSPEDGDDYLAEYEDALVAGAGRWADRGREAVRRPAPPRPAPAAAASAAGHADDWRPSDAELSGERDPVAELGRGPSVNEGALAHAVTPETWSTGLRE